MVNTQVYLAKNNNNTPKVIISRANGPGKRLVIWFQGCSIGRDITTRCRGCINPWSHKAGTEAHSFSVEMVFQWVLNAQRDHRIEGVTFTGGEPLDQPKALRELAYKCRQVGLSTFVFTGFTVLEIMMDPDRSDGVLEVDSILSGRYDPQVADNNRRCFGGSSNQMLCHITEHYTNKDFLPALEININTTNLDTVVTGTR